MVGFPVPGLEEMIPPPGGAKIGSEDPVNKEAAVAAAATLR